MKTVIWPSSADRFFFSLSSALPLFSLFLIYSSRLWSGWHMARGVGEGWIFSPV